MVYFFDSAADTSEYFDAVKAQLADKVVNDVPDQKYTEENKAGYTGIPKGETEDFDFGKHEGDNELGTGWWAASGKNIEYAFEIRLPQSHWL